MLLSNLLSVSLRVATTVDRDVVNLCSALQGFTGLVILDQHA